MPAATVEALRNVLPLAAGRTEAPEPEPVQPVAWADVEAILPHVSRTVRALIMAMWHTGARVGEAVALTGASLDRSGPAWRYVVPLHKSSWRGRKRTVWIGPAGQAAILPFLRLDLAAPIFDAGQSAFEWCEGRRAARKSKRWPSHARAQEAKRARANLDAFAPRPFTVAAVNRAVRRACERAGIGAWSPGQLRHSCATRLRELAGIEAAAATLGHSNHELTLNVYAAASEAQAAAVAAMHG